jgi:pilus assembly protein Flp/PilA
LERLARGKRGVHMLGMFIGAFVAVRSAHATMLERAGSERGASMVEYALLVGLIAVVAVVAVAALGGGIQGLFSSANTCVGGLNSTSC